LGSSSRTYSTRTPSPLSASAKWRIAENRKAIFCLWWRT
jgi:hypothetical protein